VPVLFFMIYLAQLSVRSIADGTKVAGNAFAIFFCFVAVLFLLPFLGACGVGPAFCCCCGGCGCRQ
jgi:hypothetical protein